MTISHEPSIADLRMLVSLLNVWMPAKEITPETSAVILNAQEWLDALEGLTSADEIGLAAETLTYHGYKNPLGVKHECVEPAFVISTAHITEDVANALGGGHPLGLVVYPKGGDGWWIWVGDEALDKVENLPASLFECIMAARAAECVWLCIDMDATIHDDLPTYAW